MSAREPAAAARATPPGQGETLATIAREIVRLHAEFYGRGPTRARAVQADDVVVVRLGDPFTVAERTLIDMGRRAEVHAMRATFQYEMRERFAAVVERATGRAVQAFISDITVDPDQAVEVFFLDGAAEATSAATSPATTAGEHIEPGTAREP